MDHKKLTQNKVHSTRIQTASGVSELKLDRLESSGCSLAISVSRSDGFTEYIRTA